MKRLVTGWKKDKFDHRDFLHPTVKVAKLPTSVDMTKWAADVMNQMHQGACVGFGVGGKMTSTAKKLGITIPGKVPWWSPSWIYNGARSIEGTLTQDAGAYPRDAYDWLVKMGILAWDLWPFKDALDKRFPPSKFNAEAKKHPVIKYYRIVDGANGIMSALAAGNFVSIGQPWFSAWMDVGSDGKLPKVTAKSEVAGGHETFWLGYDNKAKEILGQNSWGTTDWGNKGRYRMPFSALDAFKANGGYDCHYGQVNWKK